MNRQSIGGVEILGIELELAELGRVWLDPLERATMLFGKNGAGKTSVLTALRNLASGIAPPNESSAARIYIRVRDAGPPGKMPTIDGVAADLGVSIGQKLYSGFFDVFDSKMRKGREGATVTRRKWNGIEYPFTQPADGRAPVRVEGQPTDQLTSDQRSDLGRFTTDIELSLVNGPLSFSPSTAAQLASDIGTRYGNAMLSSPHMDPNWYKRVLLDQFATELRAITLSSEQLLTAAQPFDLDVTGFAFDNWESRTDVRATWEDCCRIWAANELNDLRGRASIVGFDELDPDPDSDEFQMSLDECREIGIALEQCCFDEIVSIRATGTADGPLWAASPAVDLGHEAARWLTDGFGYQFATKNISYLPWDWLGGDTSLSAKPCDDARYYPLALGRELTLKDFPFVLVDLNKEFNIETALGSAFAAKFDLVDSQLNGSLLLEGGEMVVDSRSLSAGQRRVAKAGERLNRLGLGLAGLRLEALPSITQWMAGRPLCLEALDTTTDSWQPFSSLSGAQKMWVTRLLQLEEHRDSLWPTLVICDEPETGIHERAVAAVLDYLLEFEHTVVLATHHPRALTRREASVVHVDRNPFGIKLRPPVLGADVTEAAERLGVFPGDLLAIKRLMIVVEGQHDEIIVRGLVALSSRPRTEDRCLVAAVRGSRHVASVASSEVLTSFTSLHFMIVTDNTRNQVLSPILEQATRMESEGAQPPRILAETGLERITHDATPEERYVLDLLRRAIEQRFIHRVRVFGISSRDIIDQLPAAPFGLSESWDDLRNAHDQAVRERDKRDFKTWLKETKGAVISAKRIQTAFDKLDELPPELRQLLDEIEIAVDIASLG